MDVDGKMISIHAVSDIDLDMLLFNLRRLDHYQAIELLIEKLRRQDKRIKSLEIKAKKGNEK